MARPIRIEIPDKYKKEICNLHKSGVGSKSLARLPRYAGYGYNLIQRLFNKCPEILAEGTNPLTNGTTAQPTPSISAPGAVQSNDTGTASFSSGWTLNDAGLTSNPDPLTLGTDFPPEAGDDDSSDSDEQNEDPYLGSYYLSPPQPIQSSLLRPVDFFNNLVSGINTTINSRIGASIAEFADRITRPLFPNLFPPKQPQKITMDNPEELVEKNVEKERKSAVIGLKDEDVPDEESSGCSCPLGNQISTIGNQSEGSTVTTVSVGSEAHGESDTPAQEQSLNAGPVTAPVTEPTTKPIEEQNQPTSKPVVITGNPEPSGPPPPAAGAVSNPAADIRPDPHVAPPIIIVQLQTPPPPVDTRSTQGANIQPDLSSNPPTTTAQAPTQDMENTESNGRNQFADNQNSIGINAITEQRPVVGVQAPVTVGNYEASSLQPVDQVSSGQQLPDTSGRLEPCQGSTAHNFIDNHHTIPDPESSSPLTDTPDGGGDDGCDLLSQRQGRISDSNAHNDSHSDFLLWAILGVLGLAFGIGVIWPYINQKKNQQPFAQLEPRALLNPQLIVAEEETKPPPPTLYSVQPQGDAAGIRIF